MEISRRRFGQVLIGTTGAFIAGAASVSAAEEKLAENPKSKGPLKFEIIIFDGFDDLDAYGALEACDGLRNLFNSRACGSRILLRQYQASK